MQGATRSFVATASITVVRRLCRNAQTLARVGLQGIWCFAALPKDWNARRWEGLPVRESASQRNSRLWVGDVWHYAVIHPVAADSVSCSSKHEHQKISAAADQIGCAYDRSKINQRTKKDEEGAEGEGQGQQTGRHRPSACGRRG